MDTEKRVFVGRTLTGAGYIRGMRKDYGGAVQNDAIDAPDAVPAGSTWWLDISRVPAPSTVTRGVA